MGLRKLLLRISKSLRTHYRRRRFQYFWQKVGSRVPEGWWLDLGGGSTSYFLSHFLDHSKVILVDLHPDVLEKVRRSHPGVSCVRANGEKLPFRDRSIACIFSNSVIEHVSNPLDFSNEIRRTGRFYFVQTPNQRFPLETHLAIPVPFYQFLPRAVQKLFCKWLGGSFDYVSTVKYCSEEDLKKFFPSAAVHRETAMGLTKSFYVIGLEQ